MSYSPMGDDLFGDTQEHSTRAGSPLLEKFIFPPFSVLDARGGAWRERKRAWLALGIQSELGRAGDLLYTNQAQLWDYYRGKEGKVSAERAASGSGTSVFDPVLCELMYTWFCPPGGQIVDPFAGGSVRGIVAAKLGFKYWGSELRAEQVEANRAQAATLCADCAHMPQWVCGDSQITLDDAPPAHFVFSCPPYGDLEVYSDNEKDLSTMTHEQFLIAYGIIIRKAAALLLPGHLAGFVVGDFRDKKTGMFKLFVQQTIEAFNSAQMSLYNDAVLVTPAGTLPVRVSGQFAGNRKLGRSHQNILIFAPTPK